MIRFLKSIPLLILVPVNVLALLLFFLSLIDPIPLDEIFLGIVLLGLTSVLILRLGVPDNGVKASKPGDVYRRLDGVLALMKLVAAQTVNTPVEVEVFLDRQILIQAELL